MQQVRFFSIGHGDAIQQSDVACECFFVGQPALHTIQLALGEPSPCGAGWPRLRSARATAAPPGGSNRQKKTRP
jgi:hypothetical protein